MRDQKPKALKQNEEPEAENMKQIKHNIKALEEEF